MKLTPIHAGNFKLDGGAMFGVVPKSMWSKAYPSDERNMIPLAMRCLLIESGDRKILVDNGIGNKQSQKFFSHYFLHGNENLEDSLAAAGIGKGDITDMLLTHLHFDHAGGSLEFGSDGETLQAAFPNATYWISESQWQWATKPNRREQASFLKENILPLEKTGQLSLFRGNEEFFPGIDVKLFDGHTAGQSLPFIKLNGKTVVFMADLIPTVAHVPLPWVMAYDTRPLLTLEEKGRFLNEASEADYILFLEHDHEHECVRLIQGEKGIQAGETGTLSQMLS